MRKRIIGPGPREVAAVEPVWLDLERLAQVEITSEDADYPIDSALIPGRGSGWRAAQSGEQTIRLLFDEPLRLTRIHLVFHEGERERTQEFVLRWSSEAVSRTVRLCASSTTSVHRTRRARPKTTTSSSTVSRHSN